MNITDDLRARRIYDRLRKRSQRSVPDYLTHVHYVNYLAHVAYVRGVRDALNAMIEETDE